VKREFASFMKPYRIAEETPTHVTYEHQTAYQYVLLALVSVGATGVLAHSDRVASAGLAGLAVYALAKLALGFEAILHIRRATRANTAEVEGTKLSFTNPLRVRVPKHESR
jgi:hypothetical protein